MTVKQQGAAEAVAEQRELRLDRFVIRAVSLIKPFIELTGGDRSSPQKAVLWGSRRDDPQPATRPGTDAAAADAVNYRRVDLVF
jgi:hypothetical protein